MAIPTNQHSFDDLVAIIRKRIESGEEIPMPGRYRIPKDIKIDEITAVKFKDEEMRGDGEVVAVKTHVDSDGNICRRPISRSEMYKDPGEIQGEKAHCVVIDDYQTTPLAKAEDTPATETTDAEDPKEDPVKCNRCDQEIKGGQNWSMKPTHDGGYAP